MKETPIEINLPYALGLLETDGSFHILFKKDPRMPCVGNGCHRRGQTGHYPPFIIFFSFGVESIV